MEIIILLQLFMFYIFPLFAGPTDAMGMVFLILLATLLLSFVLGLLSSHKLKYLYPIIAAVTFIPSVFIYYNESALAHSSWYFIVASTGLLAGAGINAVIRKLKQMK
ncbi:MAG: hypothetical protein IJO39_12310 [Clostridia bacterium]|nr:hypothetical protein [Clostridia bacterium]